MLIYTYLIFVNVLLVVCVGCRGGKVVLEGSTITPRVRWTFPVLHQDDIRGGKHAQDQRPELYPGTHGTAGGWDQETCPSVDQDLRREAARIRLTEPRLAAGDNSGKPACGLEFPNSVSWVSVSVQPAIWSAVTPGWTGTPKRELLDNREFDCE